MKVIVGLGNPGEEYGQTRHNVGFKIIDYLNKNYGGDFNFDKKLNSDISEIKINSKKALLVKPQIFVNNSGQVVKKIIRPPALDFRHLVVIHDDLDIPFGKVKTSFGRSSAGHKGVQSIIKALKTEKFYRVRIGTLNQQIVKIRKIRDKRKRLNEMNKFVISPFGGSEKTKLNKLIKDAVEKVLLVVGDRL